MFENRLRKRVKHLRRWAKRNGVTCYRLYDRDIPEVPVAVDRYEDDIVMSHFSREHQDSEEWRAPMVEALSRVLEVERSRIHVRERRRMHGASQYQRESYEVSRRIVQEGGHRFYINVSDYLDTGLFLDHRTTRAVVAEQTRGKRFLNLFCYTGSFTVYAAGAGAASSLSVDMSNRYTRWAAENLELNEADPRLHEILREDVFAFLSNGTVERDRFDVAIVDPPTFSNSKRMDHEMDLERDHGELLSQVAGHMRKGGLVFFSTNKRRFRLDEERLEEHYSDTVELTERTVPEDFRNRPHRVWRMSCR